MLNSARPQLSVIIPTTTRVPVLKRTLSALAHQDLPAHLYEVIVVIDGEHADTLQYLSDYDGPLRLRHVQQPASGPAAARNRGAWMAEGPRLLFLDDDVEPLGGLLAAHLEAAAEGSTLCLGGLVTEMATPYGFLGMGMLDWWVEKFAEMRQPGHRFGYTDLLSGHFSIDAETFAELKGFDETFRCREDYELGARLFKKGVPFRFLHQANAIHHEQPDIRKLLARSRAEGVGDVGLARKHPETILGLQLARVPMGKERLRFRPRSIRRWLRNRVQLLERVLPWLERANLRDAWRRLFFLVKGQYYVQGVRAECPDPADLKELIAKGKRLAAEATPSIDLALDWEHVEVQLTELRAASVRLVYKHNSIGTISTEGIEEPLRAAHVRENLRQANGFDLLVARAWVQVTGNKVR